MAVVHVVLFQFKEGTPPDKVQEICDKMLALKSSCLHPTTNKPYPRSLVGGVNDSPEGATGGLTHGFVVEFENNEDRMYYLDKDPAHIKFKEAAGLVLEKATVVDFVPGKF